MLRALLPRLRTVVFTTQRQPARAAARHAAVAGAQLGSTARQRRARPARRARRAPASWRGPGGAVLATGSIYLVADLAARPRGPGRSTL